MTRVSMRSALLVAVIGVGCIPDPGQVAPTIYLTPNPTTLDPVQVNGAEELDVRWYQNGEVRNDLASLKEVLAENTTKNEVWTVVVADDSKKGWAMAMDSVTIGNTPPEITALTLSTEDDEVLTSDDLQVTIEVADPDEEDLANMAYSYAWQKDGSTAVFEGDTLLSGDTAAGERWTVTITPSDGEDEGEPASLEFDVENEAPEMISVSLTPEVAYEASTLVAEGTAQDPNGDPITLTYTWLIDGLEVLSGDVSTLDGEFFDKGDVVQVSVTPYDGFVDGEAMLADAVTISNSLPTLVSVEISPDPANVTSDLSCVPSGFADDDGDEASFNCAWQVNSTFPAISDCTLWAGGYHSKGDLVRCTVTPLDGEESGDPVESDPLVVQNSPPSLQGVTLDPAAPTVADTVTVVRDSPLDADGDAISYSYAWTVNGTSAGTDDPTLSLADFSRGNTVQVEVTPGDGQDDGTPVSSSQLTIINSPPSLGGVELTPHVVASDGVITATVSDEEDPDTGDPASVQYEWFKGGISITGPTGNTLDATYFSSADAVHVVATPWDGTAFGTPAVSNVVNVNSPPTVAGVRVDPNPANVSDTITCFHDTPVEYDSGDVVSLDYTWMVNNVPSSGGSDATLTQTVSRGTVVSCTVTPSDSLESGTAVSSGDLTLSNAPPSVSVPQLVGVSTGGLRTNDVITASASASDADGDSNLSLLYAWYVEDILLPAEITDTLDGASAFEKGQEVVVQVTPYDTLDYGSPQPSAVHVVVNTPPGVATVSMSNIEPKQGQDDIVCQVDTPASDEDSIDNVDYTFAWTVDGNTPSVTPIQTHYAGDTISRDDIVPQQVWVCTVTPTDGTDDGPSADATATVLPPFEGWAVTPWKADNAADLIFEAEGDYEQIEWISGAGDVDNDGLADVLVGMKRSEYYGPSKVYLFRSSSGSLAPSTTVGNVSSADIRFVAELLNDVASHPWPDLAISSMAPIGDLDDDGFDEILMGAPYTDGLGGQDSGKAYLVWGSDSTGTGYDLSTGSGDLDLASATHSYHGASSTDWMGSSVAGAGDVNDDGFDDFLVGAEGASNNDGAAYLFLGDGSQSPVNTYAAAEADYVFTGGQTFTTPAPDSDYITGSYAGRAVEGAGDIDGDGWDDVLISETHGIDRGLVWVFYGDSLHSLGTGTHAMSTSTADHLLLGEHSYESAGTSLTRVGDVDNDGNDDVLVGAPGWSANGAYNENWGVTYLVTSSTLATLRGTQPSNTSPFAPNLYLQNADYRFEGFDSHQTAGGDVAGVQDVDADGVADFLIGAGGCCWIMDGAYLFLGGNLGGPGTYLISDADYQFQGPQHSSYGSATGRGVAGPGDINGDGLDDLLVTNSSHIKELSRAYILLAP